MEYQKITKVQQQNNFKKVTNGNNKEIPKERYISPKERNQIFNNIGPIIIV